jgi:hypothetical protein
MKRLSIYKWACLGVIAVLLAGLCLAAMPALQVQAASGESPVAETETPPADQAARGHPRLERAFRKLVDIHKKQAEAFERAVDINEKINNLVAKFQGKGVDTTALSSALSTFNTHVSEARAAYDQAGSTLGSHAGLDANGKVTDAEQAKATIQSAAASEKQQRQIMKNAARELTKAVRDFVKANRPEKPTEDIPSGEGA